MILLNVALAANSVSQVDLFLEKPVRLPFLGTDTQLSDFFFLAPILFVIVHAYMLVHLNMLSNKAQRFNFALYDPLRQITVQTRETLQWQLQSNIFIQFLAGPPGVRAGLLGWLLRTILWITLVSAPVLLLLMMQIQFLPFHSLFVVWTQRIALVVNLLLIWWLWRQILSGGKIVGAQKGWTDHAWLGTGLALSLAVVLFSWTVATFPGEWQEERLPSWPILPAMTELGTSAITASLRDRVNSTKRVSLHDWLFNATPDVLTHRRLPFSSTLVLPGLNIYEGLAIDDPEKAKWRDFVFRARGRDLRGAVLDSAVLTKVDFAGADLQGASLNGARLRGAFLWEARLEGASLNDAQILGAWLNGAQLQGASLEDAQLQGASLKGAQLQGASLQRARLEATNLSGALLWRSEGAGAAAKAILFPSTDESWASIWRSTSEETEQWSNATFEGLRSAIESLPAGRLRDDALKRLQILDCSNPDKTVASCDPNALPSPAGAAWRTALDAAGVSRDTYTKALAAVLKELVCAGGNVSLAVLRGHAFQGGLISSGAEASNLIDDLMNKDSRDCPVSGSLTDDDRGNLLQIKRRVEKAGK